MNGAEFFKRLFSGVGSGKLNIWTAADKTSAWFEVGDYNSAYDYALSKRTDGDVYFGLGLRDKSYGKFGRGKIEDVIALPCLWADIDVKGPAHKQTELPETTEAAIEFLNSLEHKPSVIVHSGNGLHVYWLLDKPFVVSSAAARLFVSGILSGWQKHVNATAHERGWLLDNTSDLARMLRVPESINHKIKEPVSYCRIISSSDLTYSVDTFKPFADKPKAEEGKDSDRQDFSGIVTGSGERALERCAFIKHCKENAAALPEPNWHAMVSNLALASDGVALCHEYSKAYSGYDKTETQDKIDRAIKEKKPHTCKYIKECLQFNCGCECKVKAPIAHTIITKAEQAAAVLSRDIVDVLDVFSDEYMEALAYAKSNMAADYAKFKIKVKGKVSLPDLEKAVKQFADKNKAPQVKEAEPLVLEGIELYGAVSLSKWQITMEQGVRKIVINKDSASEVIACPDPVVITQRLVNVDDESEKMELSFYKDGRWKSVIGGRTQIYNKASIISFGDQGLHVTTGTASDLVSYLSEYETQNKKAIPRRSSIARLGWLDATQFFPYLTDAEVVFEEDSSAAVIYKNLTALGSYEKWKEMMVALRKNSFARFLSSASFASPLLERVGSRTFVIHLWHTSTSGKSAALKAAISAWGNPLKIMGNGFTTVVGTEQLAGTLKHLPFGIDEKQSADEKKVSLEHLIYMLGQGSGKVRGARGGGNQEMMTWRNIAMLTGEEPVTKNSSLDGIQTRTLELYGKPVDSVDFAKDVHVISENNYGYAGAEFIKAVCRRLKDNPDFLIKEHEKMTAKFKELGMTGVHADYIATVALGDYLAEQIVFGKDASTALREALKMGKQIFENNAEQMRDDVVARASDFVIGWIIGNENRFSPDAAPCYGKKEMSKGGQFFDYYIIPSYLDAALEEFGFNVAKTVKGWKERGFLTPYTDSEGTVRAKTYTRINGTPLWAYLIQVKNDTDKAKPL